MSYKITLFAFSSRPNDSVMLCDCAGRLIIIMFCKRQHEALLLFFGPTSTKPVEINIEVRKYVMDATTLHSVIMMFRKESALPL